ncbi:MULTISPECIES: GNAT family N-acetyltransferase [unclassified Granulicatella]|uniref:GNAT family N-acetyltransferase n=1 Tax=unclassified Granulicatella TaxID=2630493 RepID=UPI001073C2EE|nr:MULTISPECIES: GNAT family N-acetyltransferase [unclassified Granulicatella]MBF0780530.1 GNAT family N-acetyltransferase [Granulicatella sp. 19428wC4_WM01]TFU94935.1 GNAT family N-acetyltransferase [Granulicatella sp. WM01]
MIYLRFPTHEDRQLIEDYKNECLTYDNVESIHGSANLTQFSFDEWLENVQKDRYKETVREHLVPAHTFLIMENQTLVGMCNIRHELNDFLYHIGGHIGYSVRPSQRRKGYAKQALRLAVQFLQEQKGIQRVLVTCDEDNIASSCTIEACGGILDNMFVSENGEVIKRYWIE